jgi:hypothetical protein
VRRLAASAACSISSRTTYLIEVAAGESGSITLQKAYSYGGIVACSTSIAHWRWRRRSTTSVMGATIAIESSRFGSQRAIASEPA